jgi:glyoxylase I family protein
VTTSGAPGPHAPVTGLSHVQLLVSDVSVSARWYVDALGLEPYAEDLAIGYVALRHREARVVIVLTSAPGQGATLAQPTEPASAATTNSGGVPSSGPVGVDDGGAEVGTMDHLAFAVPHADLLEGWARHLTGIGVDHPGIVLENGNPSLQLRDPDGVAIELVAPGSPRRPATGAPDT